MKYCPSCQITYADDSLQFCLQDGTSLLRYPVRNSQMQTEVFGEAETVVRQKPMSSDPEQNRITQAATLQPESKKSNTLTTITLTASVMLILFGGAAGIWLLLKDNNSEVITPSNINTKNTSTNRRGQNQNTSLGEIQIDYVDRNAVFSLDKPNPLILVVKISEDGKLSLNNVEMAKIADVALLSEKLKSIFDDRERAGIDEREVIIDPQDKVKREDLEMLIETLADVKASPIRVIKS